MRKNYIWILVFVFGTAVWAAIWDLTPKLSHAAISKAKTALDYDASEPEYWDHMIRIYECTNGYQMIVSEAVSEYHTTLQAALYAKSNLIATIIEGRKNPEPYELKKAEPCGPEVPTVQVDVK